MKKIKINPIRTRATGRVQANQGGNKEKETVNSSAFIDGAEEEVDGHEIL